MVGAGIGHVASASASARRSSPAGQLDATTRAALSAALDDALTKVDSPGVIAAVQVRNRRPWVAVRGVVDTTTNEKVTPLEHTRIGSLTKTMTGTIILQLVDDGKLRLDDTIDEWFPEAPDGDRITIRDLGTMSSGIASYTANQDLVAQYFADPSRPWAPEQLVAAGLAMPRKFPPGHGFDYSNTNFVMLGLIIERVTGKPFSYSLQTRIFDPVGMSESSYPDSNGLPDPYWHGYTVQDSPQAVDSTHWTPTFAAAAGQATSTLHDLLRWVKAVGTGSLVKPQTQRIRLQGNPASKTGNREYDFAIGQDNGWLLHDGEIPGFNTQLAYLPKGDVSIIVMANSDIGTASGVPAPVIFEALGAVIAPDNAP